MSEWWENLFATGEYHELERIPSEKTGRQVDFVLSALDVGIGDRLLDVGCGVGRHAIPFAAAGLEVTGIDYSPVYVRKAAAQAGPFPARFVQADMRALPLRTDAFDAAVSLFTSFGYFDTLEEDMRTLGGIARTLKPGGRFLIDVGHHDGLVHRFRERDWMPVKDGLMLEQSAWDAVQGRMQTVWTYVRDGEVKSFPVSLRFYTCPEMTRMLADVGMVVESVWGDWDGGTLTMASLRLIMLARKRT